MPTEEWLNKYQSVRDKLACSADLEGYFNEKVIAGMEVDVLDIGSVHLPTGNFFACDPMFELVKTPPFLQTVPAGTYPVKVCVVPSKEFGDRYACVKVVIRDEKPVSYELGMTGEENLDDLEEESFFGFGVDTSTGCIADVQAQPAFKAYWDKREAEEPDIDLYNGLFEGLLMESAKAHPKYQDQLGKWANWEVPGAGCNLVVFETGWGDGCYPVYFGYNAKREVCAVYVPLINIEESYQEEEF